jgi:GTP-binding protein Era
MVMTRFGYVAIMGAPNAGKSTLLNHLLGWPVASVTHKAHTTRQSLLGVYISGKTQIGILDTLGVTFRNREKLCPYLFPHTWNQVSRVHVVLWMVSLADRWDSKHKEFFHQFQKASLPHIQLWVVFNKKDCVKPQVALEFMEHFQQFGEKIHRFYTISCKTEWGIQDLKDDLCSVMPEGSWKYHEKTPWTASRERLAADITQEAILINLHQELPYDIHVQPISFEENELVWKMYQDIIVIKESHKPIV